MPLVWSRQHPATSHLSIILHDYDVSIDLFSTNEYDGFIFCEFDAKPGLDSYNGYYAGIGGNHKNELKMTQAVESNPGQKHELVIRTSGDCMSVYVDNLNTPRVVLKDGEYCTGLSGIRASMTSMCVNNMRIYTA